MTKAELTKEVEKLQKVSRKLNEEKRRRVAAEWVSSGYIAENKKFQIKVRELNDLLKGERKAGDAQVERFHELERIRVDDEITKRGLIKEARYMTRLFENERSEVASLTRQVEFLNTAVGDDPPTWWYWNAKLEKWEDRRNDDAS